MSVFRQITYQMAKRSYRRWLRLQAQLKNVLRLPKESRSTGQALLSIARFARLPATQAKRTWLLTLLAIVLLSACFGQRFYNEPGLDIDSIAPQTFYSPESVVFEDAQETERKRSEARNVAVSVLKIDAEQTALATHSLDTLLLQGRELRSQAGSPPFLNLKILSKPTQESLFQILDSQWTALWDLAATNSLSSAQLEPFLTSASTAASASASTSASTSDPSRPGQLAKPSAGNILAPQLVKQLQAFSLPQVAALRELVAYRELAGSERLARLKVRMDTPRQQYRKAVDELAQAASTEAQPLYNYRLFDLSEAQWLLLEDNARQIFLEMMAQGVHPGSPPDLLRHAIDVRVAADLSPLSTPDLRQLTAEVIEAAIAPNLATDEARTQQQAEQAVNNIVPVMVTVKKGDLIVKAGDTLEQADFVRLDYFGFTDRHLNWMGLFGFSGLMAAAVILYLWVDHAQTRQLNQRDHVLVLLLCWLVSILAMLRLPAMGIPAVEVSAVGIPAVGIPAVGILVASFYGSALGFTVVGLLTLVLLIGTPVMSIPLLAGAVAAMLGSGIAPRLRAREEFALLGGFVGLAQAIAHLTLKLMHPSMVGPVWKGVLVDSAMHGVYGVAWSVVALGVSPYLEHFFDVITPIRLAELSNPNRALLKRLAAEAPGTFQHTISVANLAEAAARSLGRNVELVRAGTLYHDIGKMHDPQGFIENQMGAPNKHDALNDPWLSASIIKKHVTQGLVMARKYRLPQAIQAFIPEHQGDMAIGYFYQQAKERQAAEPSLVVNEADFRYDGPIPQSPETGITMLADSCEAALRSLNPEASIDEAYSMVDKILRARWRNRQLIDSGLNRNDLDTIASVFIQVWQQNNHKRIAYPKNLLSGELAGR